MPEGFDGVVPLCIDLHLINWTKRADGSKLMELSGPLSLIHAGIRKIPSGCGGAGLFPAILGKGRWPKLGKMIDLTSKLGEINDMEHNKGSKIYPQDQVILGCNMSSIPLKQKCLSIILIWVIVSYKQ